MKPRQKNNRTADTVPQRQDAESIAVKIKRALALRLATRRRRSKIERPPWDDQAP